MMKVSSSNANGNGSNGRKAFAKTLLAPIAFYPKADGSLGSDNDKPSECDCDAMVHKVHYNPANPGSQMYKIYMPMVMAVTAEMPMPETSRH